MKTLNQDVWGPHYWFFLETISLHYPLQPNDVSKKKYYDFIQNLPLFIPNPEIGNKFSKLIDTFPVTPYLDSRISFMKWINFIHNKINKDLQKPEMDLYKSLEKYYEQYKPKDENIEKQKSNLHYKIIIVILVVLIIYLYNINEN